MELVIALLLLVLGFIGLIKGADLFVVASSKIAQKFNIPMIVIGLTIVAMGTSAPEAAISITASFNQASGITIGNIVGSNIMNILLILGICATIHPLKVGISTQKYEMPFVIGITFVLLGLGYLGNSITRADGAVLLGLFILFLAYLYQLSKKGENNSDEIELLQPTDTLTKLLLLVLVGIVLIVGGSKLTVTGATTIARTFGISERIIGLTIVAFGTSLPELMTSVTAVKKGHVDLAIGNIVGSNIFNILFVLGISGLVSPAPIPYSFEFILDTVVAILAAIVLWLGCGKKRELSRSTGIFMLVIYACYFVFLLVK